MNLKPKQYSLVVQVKSVFVLCIIVFLSSSYAPKLYPRNIVFSGTTWEVKKHISQEGPGPNYFSDSDSSVWVDAKGRLHLKLQKIEGKWQCAEVINTSDLGYGKIEFKCEKMPQNWDKNCVLGLFTWSTERANHHRELDIEISDWGKSAPNWNAQYIIQPSSRPEGRSRFTLKKDESYTHTIELKKKEIKFSTVSNKGEVLASFSKRKRFSNPNMAQIRINLWLYQGKEPSADTPIECIISAVKFLPSQ